MPCTRPKAIRTHNLGVHPGATSVPACPVCICVVAAAGLCSFYLCDVLLCVTASGSEDACVAYVSHKPPAALRVNDNCSFACNSMWLRVFIAAAAGGRPPQLPAGTPPTAATNRSEGPLFCDIPDLQAVSCGGGTWRSWLHAAGDSQQRRPTHATLCSMVSMTHCHEDKQRAWIADCYRL